MKKILLALAVVSTTVVAQVPGDWNTAKDMASEFVENKNTQMMEQQNAYNAVSDRAENFSNNGGFSQFRPDNSRGSIQRPNFGGERPEFNRPEIEINRPRIEVERPHVEFRR